MDKEGHIAVNFSIEALQNGDEQAFEVVFKRYYRALCYFGEKLLHHVQLAEEVAGSVLLKLWEKRQGFSDENAIKAFLYISTRNACLNQLDKEKRRRRRDDTLAVTLDTFEESVMANIFHAEALRNIYQAIEDLPEKYAKVIRMAYVDGLSNNEIAEKLNLPQSTVRNQKARGLSALKKQFPEGVLQLLLLFIGI